MARKVSPRYVAGARCPKCGGAVRWEMEEYHDPKTPYGIGYRKSPIYVMSDKRLCVADEVVETPIKKNGHEVSVRTRYRHALDVSCKVCNNIFSSFDLVKGEPNEYPAGYFVDS